MNCVIAGELCSIKLLVNYFYFTEEVSQHLAGVNGVIEILLKHATSDELSSDVKQNAAICLAKLATADKRYRN